MRIEYNGVNLHVVELNRYERVNVFSPDGVDLLYVRHLIGATCVLAPGGYPRLPSVTRVSDEVRKRLEGDDNTASTLRTRPRGLDPAEESLHLEIDEPRPDRPVPQSLHHSGPESDAEIRNRLAMPRRKLILWAWSKKTGKEIRWLESPREGFDVDASNGPIPISWDVVAADGEPNSLGVFFQIRTDLPPCPVGSDRFVLSHRWEMTHGQDENYYLTRKIDGEIVFHAGVKELLGKNPDWIRNQFLHPVPLGFRRAPTTMVMSSDGLTIHYSILDTDQSIVFSPGDSGATKLDIAERVEMTFPLGNEGTFLI